MNERRSQTVSTKKQRKQVTNWMIQEENSSGSAETSQQSSWQVSVNFQSDWCQIITILYVKRLPIVSESWYIFIATLNSENEWIFNSSRYVPEIFKNNVNWRLCLVVEGNSVIGRNIYINFYFQNFRNSVLLILSRVGNYFNPFCWIIAQEWSNIHTERYRSNFRAINYKLYYV